MDQEPVETLRFDGDNSFPDCEGCGRCCEYMCVFACSPEELQVMRDYVAAHNIQPIDYHRERCCFQGPDRLCMIWEARPQICKLHHCKVSRFEILRQNPSIVVDDTKPLVDFYDAFFNNDDSDPRYRKWEMTGLGKALTALFLALVLLVGAYVGSRFVLNVDHFLSLGEIQQLVTTGSLEKRTSVEAPAAVSTTDRPAILYSSLYEDGSSDQKLFSAAQSAIQGFQQFDRDQQLTWVNAGMDVGSEQSAQAIGEMIRQILNDSPSYSVQYPSAPVNASGDGSLEVLTSGNRFMVRGLYLQPTAQEALGYYQQVLEKTQSLHEQALSQSDGTEYGYIKECFSLLASSMVYSRAADEGPWYSNNVYGALLGGESECVGMSGALKVLLDAQGIPNFIATGKSSTSQYGHAWNVVYYNKSWYVCDLTRCVADVVSVDQSGNEVRLSWKVGDRPQLETRAECTTAGFMIEQADYLSGASVVSDLGTKEYSFGGSVVMDEQAYRLEESYQAADRLLVG